MQYKTVEEQRLAAYFTTEEGRRRLEDLNARKQKYATGIQQAISHAINKWKTDITKRSRSQELPESISNDEDDARCDIHIGGHNLSSDQQHAAKKQKGYIQTPLPHELFMVIIELYN